MYEQLNLKKSDYDGKDFEGNQCDIIMNNTDDLDYHIPEEHVLLKEAIEVTKKLNIAVCEKH